MNENEFDPVEIAKKLLRERTDPDKSSINSAIMIATVLSVVFTSVYKIISNKKAAIELTCDLVITYFNRMAKDQSPKPDLD